MQTNGIVSIVREGLEEHILVGNYPAWIYLKDKTEKTENGRKKTHTLSARIPRLNISVKTGNYISPCELKEPDIRGLYLITEVRRNSFGRNPHIHIEAELG